MDEGEPAWRAELRKTLGEVAEKAISAWDAEVPGAEGALHDVLADMTLSALAPHILAAEEGGRREALKQHTNGLKADWGRFRGRVLQEAWEALRDAEGGPLVDGMSVINRLLESP